MVDPVTLGAVVAMLVAKSVDQAAGRAVDDGAGVLVRLVGRLRARFADDADPAAATALAHVEEVPDSPKRLQALAELVDRRAGTDADFKAALEALVAEAGSAGVDVGTITQTAWGDRNVQNAGVVGSDINITYN